MNDFTKEELQYIWESIDYNCKYRSEPDVAYACMDKIQFLIDNFDDNKCPHNITARNCAECTGALEGVKNVPSKK